LNYLIQTTNEVRGKSLSSFIDKILVDKDTHIANWIRDLKAEAHVDLSENEFLKSLIPSIDPRKGYPSIVLMKEANVDANTSNVLTSSFLELYNNFTPFRNSKGVVKTIHEIMENLIIAGILQQGVMKTKTNFVPLIPEEIYAKYVTKVVDNNSTLDTFAKLDLFYRLNWSDDQLVPIVRPFVTDDEYETKYYPYIKGTSILKLDEFEYSKKKFVKIVNYPKKADNSLDFDNPIVTLYKRVDTAIGEPFIKKYLKLEDGEPVYGDNNEPETEGKVFFKPAIKYGANYVQEMPLSLRPSILTANQTVVKEQSDLDVRKVIEPAKIKEIEEEYLSTDVYEEEDEISPEESGEDKPNIDIQPGNCK
jgi:hypothetical protein